MEITSGYCLHRQTDKQRIYKKHDPLWWSQPLGRWMCVDPDLISQILNDKDFIVHHYGVAHIEKRFNIDLSHISNMVNHFPLASEGEKHKENRKKFAVALAQNSDLA